jgi:hypothetical protein
MTNAGFYTRKKKFSGRGMKAVNARTDLPPAGCWTGKGLPARSRNRKVSASMNPTFKRMFGIFSAALIGYMFGWILGWSSFDPDSDVWALAAAVGAIAGLAVGVTPLFWNNAGMFYGSALGLYVGWLLRTLSFGDAPGGLGLVFVIGGAIAGGWMGAGPAFRQGSVPLRVLIGALYIGFFGGFLIDVILLDVVFRLVRTHSVLGQAPAVIVSGVIGGWLGARLGRADTLLP